MHSTNYGRTTMRCAWWGMLCVLAAVIFVVLDVALLGSVALLAAGLMLSFRAAYYLGRYEEHESGGDREWSLFNDNHDHH